MRFRLTPLADTDVAAALRTTFDLFGPRQVAAYVELIETAIGALAADPEYPGSRPRPELGASLQSLHLRHAAQRRRGARHEIYYRVQNGTDGKPELVVMRVLHDAMEPASRISAALCDDLKRS